MRNGGALSTGAKVFLVLQALAVSAWWLWLATYPSSRALFAAPEHESALLAFSVPDILILVLLSAVTSAVARLARLGTAMLVGATVYATLFCLGYSLLTGDGWLGFGLMLPMAAGNAFLCISVWIDR